MRFDQVEKFRLITGPFASSIGDPFGAFRVWTGAVYLDVIASSGISAIPWEHVSVSRKDRCPTWAEMCFVKDLFWDPEEAVMQLHPPRSMWVNQHPHCLHLWRPVGIKIPLPPVTAV